MPRVILEGGDCSIVEIDWRISLLFHLMYNWGNKRPGQEVCSQSKCFVFLYKVDEYAAAHPEWNKQLDDEIAKNNWNMEH